MINSDKNLECCIKILLKRRSIREYKNDIVPIEIILDAINIARYAPSAKNSQPWKFIIINDRRILNELSKLHFGAAPLRRCRLGIVVLADPRESPVSYIIDASLATLYLWLALECMDLGAVWIQTLRKQSEIRRILDVPEVYVPVSILAIGWPNEKPKPKYLKPVHEITFLNKYGVKISNKLAF